MSSDTAEQPPWSPLASAARECCLWFAVHSVMTLEMLDRALIKFCFIFLLCQSLRSSNSSCMKPDGALH